MIRVGFAAVCVGLAAYTHPELVGQGAWRFAVFAAGGFALLGGGLCLVYGLVIKAISE